MVASNEEIAPDGYKVQRMLFNGTYPGPTLEGNWGDTFSKSSQSISKSEPMPWYLVDMK